MDRPSGSRPLTRPELLLVDDVSSALDVNTERELWQRLRAAGDSTIIAISHRQLVVDQADQVVTPDGGRIAEVTSRLSGLSASPGRLHLHSVLFWAESSTEARQKTMRVLQRLDEVFRRLSPDSPRLELGRAPLLSVAAVLGAALCIVVLAAQDAIEFQLLSRDPIVIAEITREFREVHGLLSNVGILLWTATAALCLFAASELWFKHDCREGARLVVLRGEVVPEG